MEFKINECHRNVSDLELLEDIRRVSNDLNKSNLTQADYKKYGKYGATTIRRRFGSWIKAIELCGMQPNVYQKSAALSGHDHQNVDTIELLDDIRRVALMLHKESISSHEYNMYGLFSSSTCFKRFISWNDALKQAGLQPFIITPGKRIDDEVLLKEIERVWIKLGRQPTSSDIKAGVSNFSLHAYAQHFGGWRGALQSFIQYIEEPASDKADSDNSFSDFNCKQQNSGFALHYKNKSSEFRHKTPRSVNYRLRFKVMQRDNFKCCLCGNSPAKNPNIELHVDHIIPWVKGGETVLENLQTLCSVCNLGKSDLDM